MGIANTVKDDSGDWWTEIVDPEGRRIVTGAAVEDAAVAGNPVLVGGRYDSTNRDLDDGDVGVPALNADAQLIVDDDWAPSLQAEESENDSDKTFTVPASTRWRVQSIWVEYTSTGNAGNRQLVIEIQDDGADVIFQIVPGLVQAASLTYKYAFAPGLPDMTAVRDSDFLMTPFPQFELGAGYKIRVYEKEQIDAAADDMVVQMLIEVRTV
jgi:hypothetical protein